MTKVNTVQVKPATPDNEKDKAFNHQEIRAKVLNDVDYFIKTYSGKVLKYAELMEKAIEKAKDDGDPVQQKALNMMFDFLASIDTAKNGELSAEEVDEAADMIRIIKKMKKEDCKLHYKHLPESVRNVLEGWDTIDPKTGKKDGTVDAKELEAAAEAQQKMSKENRLVKKLLVGAIIVVLLLSAGTFALSLTAAEMAKETKASPNGVIETTSGKVAAMGVAVDRKTLVDFPSYGIEKLKELRDFGYFFDQTYQFRFVSAFDWHSEMKMEITATNGEVISIDNGVLTVQKPGDPKVYALDPEAGRQLGLSGGLMTSGSFTMMSSGGLD
jgi:hypothetical protein